MVLIIPHGTQDIPTVLMIIPHGTEPPPHGTEHTFDRVKIFSPLPGSILFWKNVYH